MMLDGDLTSLERERDRETARLRTRLTALVDTVEREKSPAHWVRDHPYIALGSAALAGFAISRLPVGGMAGALHATMKNEPPTPAATPAEAPRAKGFPWAQILEVITGLAQSYATAAAASDEAAPAATVNVADAGAVKGENFPFEAFQATQDAPTAAE